jgi:hypothetical protein
MIHQKAIDLEVVFKTRLLIPPCKLDYGIRAADGLENNFRVDNSSY